MGQSTKTPQSVWSSVYRSIVARVEQDGDVRRVFGVDNVLSWSGKPGDFAPLNPVSGPLLRLTPNPGNVQWYDPSAQFGTLSVTVEIAVPGVVVDECMDLYDLLVTVLSPTDDAFCRSLVALGAETGEIVFGSPAYDANPEAKPQGYFVAKGSFSLTMVRSILS